jgi:periplasmic divalent cation tolerance protein
MSARLVHISCPDAAAAHALARSLVDARLAACVAVLAPQVAYYRWKGAVERADETGLLAKTWADRVEDLVAHVVAAHPYELPEVLAVEAGSGLDRYLDWIHAETRTPADP